MSGTDDVYAPEEPTPDISMSLLDIQMPETPESTKGQASDGDTCRLESPRLLKPVLGKVQAKKRLMAFANKFNVLPKIRNKSIQAINATKDDLSDESNTNNAKTQIKAEHSQQPYNRYSSGNKLRKKTEEKILAIEEIRREESKSKLLLAEAMAAASLEEENLNKNNSTSWDTSKNLKERCNQNESISFQKSSNKSVIERKRKQHKEEKEENTSKEIKERHENKERYKSPQNREQYKKDRERKDDKSKRDDVKVELSRDKKDDGRDKRENQKDKRDEIRQRKDGSKDRREKQNDFREGLADVKDKKDKDKFKDKEREMIKYESWTELRNSGVTLDEVIQLRRQENLERPMKNRTVQDYTRYLDQMLMLNNCHLKRSALIIEGLNGPKEFPPESIRFTKRGRQLIYCENPRVSLLLTRQQLFQAVTIDRREKLRDICDATSTRSDLENNEEPLCTRNWYKKVNMIEPANKIKWHLSTDVQLPKSKWDSEDEEITQENDETKNQGKQMETENIVEKQEKVLTSCSSHDENNSNIENPDNQNDSDSKKCEIVEKASSSPVVQPAGNEKLASEYEQFMKMVCTDIPLPDTVNPAQEFTSEKCLLQPVSLSNYHEFNIEVTSSEDKCNTYSDTKSTVCENQNKITSEVLSEKNMHEEECLENPCVTFEHSEHSTLSVSSQTPVQESENTFENTTICREKEESQSIPSDWENVRIKVECLSDENSEPRKEKRRKRHIKKKTSSSSESSSSSSSSDSEDKKSKRKRKRKLSQDSSSSDSDSSESSSTSSSSESLSSDSKRKKKKRKKRKIGKRKKKAKRIARIKKRRRRKISSPSSSSESDERRKRRKVMKKKLKSRKVLTEKELNNAEIVSELSDSTTKHTLQNKLVSMQSSSKKIKEEIDIKGQGEKHNLWEKVDTLTAREMDVNINSKSIINKENQDKTTKKFLEEWEVDSVLIAKQLDSEMLKDDEQNKVKRMDRRDKNIVTNEQMKEKQCNENFLEGKQKIENELEEKKKRKKDKEKKINTEFLAEWERESERIARQIIQDDLKFSKKLEKHKKEKWGETEFDTLNVPSLTQLENEVSKGQLLADEWEVDSLEAIADLAASKRRSSRNSTKKLEKEVKYDKKTDTYISVDKESARENRKRIERLCTIRIWEDEEEEGEREAMMLVQEKNKRKKDDWDIEEESFMRGSEKGKDSIDTSSVASATSATTTVISDITDIAVNVQPDLSINYIQNSADRSNVEILDKLKENEFTINKKTKKSRWDIGSQSDEKMELKASVMWEDECAEWSNITKPEKLLLKNKAKDDICHVTNQPLNIEKSSSKYSENSANFLKRKQSCTLKLEDKELLEQSWSENSNIDTIIDKVSIINKKNPSTERLKTILDIDTRLGQRNMELYSPSSPAPSQKSEDIEASSGSNSTSFNKNRLHRDKNVELCKMEEQLISSSSIPLQLKKFHENICTTSHIQNVGTYSKVEKCNKMDAENSEKLLSSLHSDSSSDVHPSKSLQMDMFAEYETERSYNNENIKHINTTTETSTKNDETNEGKTSFKLIPKQFLIRRSNEHEKSKKIEVPLQDPAQQVAALLTIQKKLLQSRMLDSDKKDKEFSVAASTCTTNVDKILNANIASTDECSSTDLAVTVTNVKLGSKEEVLKESQLQDTTHSKLPTSDMLYPGHSKEYNVQDTKKGESTKTSKVSIIADNSDTDIQQSIKSSSKEQKRQSPIKKEDDKRYNDRNKNRRDRKIDDRDRIDRRDYKNSRMEYNEKRKMSPMRSKRRLIDSPCSSWEREESASGSHSRSWSRSRSKSPRRRDETIVYTKDRDRKLNKNTDHRSIRARDVDNRKERFTRSPERSATTSYSKTNRSNRDEWNKKKYGSMDRDQEREIKPYNPLEILRERNMDSNKYSENRVQVEEETDQTFWQFEVGNPLRDGESLDSFGNHQDLNVGYNKSYYRDESLEREIMEGPISSMSKSRQSKRDRLNTRRNQQWVEGGDTTDLERYAHSIRRVEKIPPRRSRLSPSLRHSPPRSSTDRFRRVSRSRSRSRSWSRSRSRSRSRTKSRSRSRSRSSSRSRSRSKLPSKSRSRSRSTSRTRLRKRSPENDLRMSENLHTSRSPSLLRDRISGNVRERKEENDSRNNGEETGRRIETIVQSASSVTRVTADSTVMDSEMQINSSTDNVPSNFQYSGVNESSNDYYYTENNLTYPPCIDESATSSPKRLSLDDRLELELGIKKQHEQETNVLSDYSNNFNPNNVVYPSPPPQQQQQLYRRQPRVLQVGNVLQVVPADYNGISPAHTEVPAITTPPIVRGSSQVVRVGNVLQVVPTSLDWSSGTSSTVDQPGTALYSAIPSTSPVPVPISVPIPVPVPMPVPAIPSVSSTPTPSSTLSPVPLPLSVPVPTPVPIPIPTTTYPRSEITVQKISAQPVYNYEAILESRRKEREERKRLREMRRKEKERRRIERVNRRALRLLEKKTIGAPQSENTTSLDRRIPPAIDHSVIKALHEGDEEATSENQPEKEQENSPSLTTSIEEEDAPGDDDEDDEEEEAEGEDEDDDYEDPEDDEEEEELDDQKSIARVENRKEETGEVETSISDVNQAESKLKDWPLLPVAPLKGILISPGFRKDTISNGNIDNLSTADEDNEDYIDKEEPGLEKISDVNKGDNTCESKINLTKHKMKLRTKTSHKNKRAKKSVQFADGIKPGEGTSPSGGEGDMPSPPPPSSMTSQDSPCDLKRSLSKRIRKEKRARHPKTKKKVKVKIIKLKKPRITPLSAMMTEDSDELDDLPPPPPPPGSPPPPHLWPSYLSAHSGTVKAAEIQSIIVPTPTPVQAPPPPTPLPLLVPPPPLNYTIQPCTKA